MSGKYNEYKKQLVELIKVGQSNQVDFEYILKSLQTKHTLNAAFIKGIRREIEELSKNYLSEKDEPLLVIAFTGGKKTYYYWQDENAKNLVLDELIPEFSSEARAMAINFVQEQLSEFLPPKYIDELRYDFRHSEKLLRKKGVFRDKLNAAKRKLDFHPAGFAITPIEADCDKQYAFIFDCLENEIAFTAQYDSIHNIPKKLTLSPQKITYLNHQVVVLCLMHEENELKFFEITRLKNVAVCSSKEYIQKSPDYFESKHTLKARVHTWVKNYFSRVQIGHGKAMKIIDQEDEHSWIIEIEIMLGKHFNNDKPDPFYFANFLGQFADSIEVLEPDCLRSEMIRRAKRNYSIYLDDCSDNIETISKSPFEMTGEK
ncbi:WYL domain-containing protein [Colwellia sp. BRX8-9]|uniref:WYL domain-containing protein n=1 Tax=Colwellia sp. BRX8-9 TaxID=2759831 RepID=UPI0015F6AD28|nr:WYL domain-containing protein [Colwellia sp. BRX8-9]MBA6350049.1 WYL domain-containing protein [Colwellia sp. BRX8-9]